MSQRPRPWILAGLLLMVAGAGPGAAADQASRPQEAPADAAVAAPSDRAADS